MFTNIVHLVSRIMGQIYLTIQFQAKLLLSSDINESPPMNRGAAMKRMEKLLLDSKKLP
jgi:hypothetical protein